MHCSAYDHSQSWDRVKVVADSTSHTVYRLDVVGRPRRAACEVSDDCGAWRPIDPRQVLELVRFGKLLSSRGAQNRQATATPG